MAEAESCPQCGAELPVGVLGGLCPKCLGAIVFQVSGPGAPAKASDAQKGVPPQPNDRPKPGPTIPIGESQSPDPNSRSDAPGSGQEQLLQKPGDRIGHYKLLQQIGEGGCGSVIASCCARRSLRP